uniref:Uncharacterized protein n=1 Tax=Ditylenchus dipsaci TaxID=166011 RepID=A0A915EMQ2_9BILA
MALASFSISKPSGIGPCALKQWIKSSSLPSPALVRPHTEKLRLCRASQARRIQSKYTSIEAAHVLYELDDLRNVVEMRFSADRGTST